MRHRILILGAGYAGASAAGYLARQLHPDDIEVTVVSAEPDFVERIRLHQLAAGQELRRHGLAQMFAGTGIRLRIARVTALDAEQQTVTVADDEGTDRLTYDTLLYTLGSTTADHGVSGVHEHAFPVAERPSVLGLRQRLDRLGENGRVLVVGGNLTAIETATEIAESRPGLRVTLATSGEPGGWLSPKARRHLLRAFDRFGITVHEHTTVERVTETGAVTADGTVLESDATAWAAGFAARPIAADGGLTVEGDGRIAVDATMRSVSHPQVYAAGDSVHAVDANGRTLPMSCATAGFTRMRATAAIIRGLTGRTSPVPPLAYFGNCISLGQKDGIFQRVDDDAQAKPGSLRGRPAAHFKSFVFTGTVWNMNHPTYGLPARRRRVAAVSARSAEVAAE